MYRLPQFRRQNADIYFVLAFMTPLNLYYTAVSPPILSSGAQTTKYGGNNNFWVEKKNVSATTKNALTGSRNKCAYVFVKIQVDEVKFCFLHKLISQNLLGHLFCKDGQK